MPRNSVPSQNVLSFLQRKSTKVIINNDLGCGVDVAIEASGAVVCATMMACMLKAGGVCESLMYFSNCILSFSCLSKLLRQSQDENKTGSKASNGNNSDPGISRLRNLSPARGVSMASKSSNVLLLVFLFARDGGTLDWLWPALRPGANLLRWCCNSCSIMIRLRLAPDHRTSISFRNAMHFSTSSRTSGLR